MTIKSLSVEAVSATGSAFLIDSLSASAGISVVPYSKIMDGRAGGTAVAAVTVKGLAVDPGPVAISGTAMVQVMNQLDASVHGVVSISGQIDASVHGVVSVSNQIDASVHGVVSVSNQVDASVHGVVSIAAGAANIGKVEITSTATVVVANQLDASVHGQVSAFVTNTVSTIASGEIGSLYNGTTALTPKFANISMNTAGAQIVIAAVAAKKLRVLNMSLVAKSALGVYITDGGGGNNLMGDSTNKVNIDALSGFVLGYSPAGWMQTSASSSLTIVPDVATSIAGTITYVEV